MKESIEYLGGIITICLFFYWIFRRDAKRQRLAKWRWTEFYLHFRSSGGNGIATDIVWSHPDNQNYQWFIRICGLDLAPFVILDDTGGDGSIGLTIGKVEGMSVKDISLFLQLSDRLTEEFFRRISSIEGVDRVVAQKDTKSTNIGWGYTYWMDFQFMRREGESFADAIARTVKGILTVFGVKSVQANLLEISSIAYVSYMGKWMRSDQRVLLKHGVITFKSIEDAVKGDGLLSMFL